MITFITIVLLITISYFVIIEKYILASILSLIVFIGIITYKINSGAIKPFNVLKTSELRNNLEKYNNTEIRIEFATVYKTKFIKKDKKGNILIEFSIYNGNTFYNLDKNIKQLEKNSIKAFAWIPAKSDLWKTYLKPKRKSFIKRLWYGRTTTISTFCRLKIKHNQIFLKELSPMANSDFINLPYDLSYRFFNSFLSQKTSGIISIIIEVIALFIMLILIISGVSFIELDY